jgi:ABC-type lipopolysaccharide export system ATPase subunit
MLTVSQLSKSFAGRALFDDVSLQVNRGDRIVEVEAAGGAGDLQEDVGLAAASKLQSDRSLKIVLT